MVRHVASQTWAAASERDDDAMVRQELARSPRASGPNSLQRLSSPQAIEIVPTELVVPMASRPVVGAFSSVLPRS